MKKIKILIICTESIISITRIKSFRWIEFPCNKLSENTIKRAFKKLGDKYLERLWTGEDNNPNIEIKITDAIKIGDDIFISTKESGIKKWEIDNLKP